MTEFLVAFAVSALAGLGVGGGGLLLLYLLLVKGTEQLTAQGINIAFFLAGAAASLPLHFRKRHINFPLAVMLGILGAAGSFLGASLAERMSPALLQKAFGFLLCLMSGKTLLQKFKK